MTVISFQELNPDGYTPRLLERGQLPPMKSANTAL